MGALTNSRKRGDDYFKSLGSPPPIDQLYDHISKKPKLSVPMSQSTPQNRVPASPSSVASRISRYPENKHEFGREIHAPVRSSKYGLSSSGKKREVISCNKESLADGIGMSSAERKFEKTRDIALGSLRYPREGNSTSHHRDVSIGKQEEKGVIEVDSEDENRDAVSDDSSIEEVEIVDFVGSKSNKGKGAVENSQELNVKLVEKEARSLDSSVVTDVCNVNEKMDRVEKMDLMKLDQLPDDLDLPIYKKLLNGIQRDARLSTLTIEIEIAEKKIQSFHLLRPAKKEVQIKKDVSKECFLPLTKEEEREVSNALSNANRRRVLVTHENSNIDITGEKLQCLRPGAWLNDEVINVYLELLKEREKREPEKFLKCHFFNTFFYKKLINGRGGYNFQSVRRWTTQRKLGYSLLECEKIFVPIHQQIHWTLAIINKKEQKIQYLDSLRGVDTHVVNVLARYFVDEVKDKCGKDIDVSSWEQEFVEDLPEQENGFDCGMFMVKYADFYSRDIGLCFGQDNMPYFRRRTAKEILRLRAD